MKRDKSEKLLNLYYKEQIKQQTRSYKNNKIEILLKVALILNFAMLIFTPLKTSSNIDFTGVCDQYKDEIIIIKKNINIAFKE